MVRVIAHTNGIASERYNSAFVEAESIEGWNRMRGISLVSQVTKKPDNSTIIIEQNYSNGEQATIIMELD